MKLSAYKELDSSKRSQTLSRIILIAGAHLVIIGGAYLVTTFGGNQSNENGSQSMAGVGTWSNQGPSANQPSVDASSNSLFDKRASNLAGYNAGDPKPVVLAAASNSAGSKPRYAPRRPSDDGDSGTNVPTPSYTAPERSTDDDEFLQPVNKRSNDNLYPDRNNSASQQGLSQTIEYRIQPNDSLWAISKRFSVSVPEITSANPGIKANAVRVGQIINIPRTSQTESIGLRSSTGSEAAPSKPANGSIYTVKSGDVLSRIASRQGMTVKELKDANGLTSDSIRIGQELIIPSTRRSSSDLVAKQHRGRKVIVEAGDTLGEIAAIHGVSATELMALNDISNPRLMRIGQTLLIPEKSNANAPSRTSGQPTRTTPEPATRTPARNQTQTEPSQPARTLEDLPPVENEMPTLEGAFGEEDLEDQPLIQIAE